MKKHSLIVASVAACALISCKSKYDSSLEGVEALKNNNPVFQGWYADPEAIIFGNEYWVYPTYSDEFGTPDVSSVISDEQKKLQKNSITPQYLKQTFLNAFSSTDLVHWKKHSHVLDIKDVSWAAYAVWAPSIIHDKGKYYLFFGANDIQNDNQIGGIGVAVSDKPEGPFKDAIGKPLINTMHNGAQPIDQCVFKDDDGQNYLYYGGWAHCNIVKLSKDFLKVEKFDDGETYKEITPENYVEGPFVFKRNGKYFMMWSEGGWFGPDYSVAYGISDSPTGPFKRVAKILKEDPQVARGAGHNSVIHAQNTEDWYIVYHRRPLNTDNGNQRETCIDRMYFNEDGTIKPIKITYKGVEANPLVKNK